MKTVEMGVDPLSWPSFLVGLLVAAVLFAILEYPGVEKRAANNWKSLHRWERSDLQEARAVRSRYGMFLDLGEMAPGAKLVIAKRRHLPHRDSFRQLLFGFGRVSTTEVRDFDPYSNVPQYSENAATAISGNYGKYDFKIVAADFGKKEFMFFMPGEESILILDTALIADQSMEGRAR